MKIIHCADLHLDSRLTGLDHNKAIMRRLELLQTFRDLVKQAEQNDVEAIVIAGDLFDNRFVSSRTKDDVAEIFSSADVQFYVLSGNHDASAFDETYLKRMPKNVHVFDGESSTFHLGDVTFIGIEGENLSRQLIESLDLDENRFNVLVTHADLTAKSQYGGLDLKWLTDKPVDYVALGHIHRPYLTTAGRGHAAYSGCLECRGFDEPGEHGFYLVKTHYNDANRVAFVPFSRRVCTEHALDVTGLDNRTALLSAAEKLLADVRPDDLVNLTLVGEIDEKTDVETPLKIFLNGTFFGARLKNNSKIRLDETKYADAVSLKAEYVRKVNAFAPDEETKRELLRYGFNALGGEEIDTL